MAELADAHGSGPCESNFMRVQVPFSALIKSPDSENQGFFFFLINRRLTAYGSCGAIESISVSLYLRPSEFNILISASLQVKRST